MTTTHLAYTLRWSAFFICLFTSALFLAWILSAQQQFYYPFWYQQLDINETISQYGPQNRNISGFENTSVEERIRLFSEINRAVHNNGEGLSTLTFYDPKTQKLKAFLTHPEIIHLKDVAKLIDIVFKIGWAASCLTILWLAFFLWRKEVLPNLIRSHIYGFMILTAGIAAIMAIGAEKVFYQFHIWVFPPGHPWFFYYQDSLMSTSMQAPILFGAIAAQLLLFTLGLYGIVLIALSRGYPYRNNKQH